MHFVIGTTNKPKSEAIEQVLNTCPYTQGKVTFSNHKVDSGVPDMPLTLRDIRNGAKNRAKSLREIETNSDYYVGMEGGVYKDIEGENYWIMGVVYIENQKGIGHYGYSYHLEVPQKVIELLHDGQGKDLEEIMHILGAPKNIGDSGGSPSEWSDGMLVRKDEFIFATQAALAPFFNKYY